MQIKGLQKTTLLDYPGQVACTVFTGGCNFRCPFCHNASLVLAPNAVDSIPENEFFAFLSKRKGILDGVCVTGGEPLLQNDIIPFLERIRSMGFKIKLDTNGSFPQRLEEIISLGLVDHIAMDIKNSPEKYGITSGASCLDQVLESIQLIMESGISYEFRTTVVRELHEIEDIEEIGKLISGAEQYFLQAFKDSDELIGEGFSAYSDEEMEQLLSVVLKYVPSARIRGK